MKTIKFISICNVFSLLISVSAFATPIISVIQDGENNAFSDWVILGSSFGAIDLGTAGGGVTLGTQTGIEITGTYASGNPPVGVYGTSASDFIGDLTQNAGISFDFYAGGNGGAEQPFGAYLFFSSDHGGANQSIYSYQIDPPIIDSWGTYGASFSSSAWLPGSDYDLTSRGSGADLTFENALGAVDYIGLIIEYRDDHTGLQTYGIDNFALTVPEPETYLILGMALLSVGMVFRKKITESLVEARAMLQI